MQFPDPLVAATGRHIIMLIITLNLTLTFYILRATGIVLYR